MLPYGYTMQPPAADQRSGPMRFDPIRSVEWPPAMAHLQVEPRGLAANRGAGPGVVIGAYPYHTHDVSWPPLIATPADGGVGVGSIFDDAWNFVTHPGDWPSDFVNAVAHPGELVKPLAYAAMLAAGPAGVAYAYAADRSGALDGLARVVDLVGGVYVKLYGAVCEWLCGFFEVPEAGIGCVCATLAVDLAKACYDRDLSGIVDVLKRLALWGEQYDFDVTDAIKSLLDAAFQALGDDADRILEGGIQTIQTALAQVMTASEAAYVVGLISEHAAEAQSQIAALPAGVKGSLARVKATIAGGKAGGQDAVSGGKIKTGAVTPARVARVLPFAPPGLRRFAVLVDGAASQSKAGAPDPGLAFLHITADSIGSAAMAGLAAYGATQAELDDWAAGMVAPASLDYAAGKAAKLPAGGAGDMIRAAVAKALSPNKAGEWRFPNDGVASRVAAAVDAAGTMAIVPAEWAAALLRHPFHYQVHWLEEGLAIVESLVATSRQVKPVPGAAKVA